MLGSFLLIQLVNSDQNYVIPMSLTSNKNITIEKAITEFNVQTKIFRCPLLIKFEDDAQRKQWVAFEPDEFRSSIWEKDKIIKNMDATITTLFDENDKQKTLQKACEQLSVKNKNKMKKVKSLILNSTAISKVIMSMNIYNYYRSTVNLAQIAHALERCVTNDEQAAIKEVERIFRAAKVLGEKQALPCLMKSCTMQAVKFKQFSVKWTMIGWLGTMSALLMTARMRILGYVTVFERGQKIGRRCRLFKPMLAPVGQVGAVMLEKVTKNRGEVHQSPFKNTKNMHLEEEEEVEEALISKMAAEQKNMKHRTMMFGVMTITFGCWIMIKNNSPEKTQTLYCKVIESVIDSM